MRTKIDDFEIYVDDARFLEIAIDEREKKCRCCRRFERNDANVARAMMDHRVGKMKYTLTHGLRSDFGQ